MPRGHRRPISDTGHLRCTKCNETKHISEFYCNRGVWFIQEDPDTGEGTVYGKPNSWCKQCQKASQKQRRDDVDTEWTRAVEAARLEGYALVKERDGTVRAVPMSSWNR